MSTWEFRVATKDVTYGEDTIKEYGLVEVYYDDKGEVEFNTDFKDPNGWEELEDLKATIVRMQQAFDKPVIGHMKEDGSLDT